MALPASDNILNNTLNHYNKWADYIECLCLENPDHLLTVDDFLDFYLDHYPEETEKGDATHASKQDKFISKVQDIFIHLNVRSQTMANYYPFETTNHSISCNMDFSVKQELYLFLLLSSNLYIFDRTILYDLTHAFEDVSCWTLESISPDIATTKIFGTARNNINASCYNGNLRNRICSLANDISSTLQSKFYTDEQFDVPGGDHGLDLIAYVPLDNSPYIPISFGQCACSYENWTEKQFSIHPDHWNPILCDLAPYLRYTFVPFNWRDSHGRFKKETSINTCLIDRTRFIVISEKKAAILEKYIAHPIKQRVKEIINY